MRFRGLELPLFSPEAFVMLPDSSVRARRLLQELPQNSLVRIALAVAPAGCGLKSTLDRANAEYRSLKEHYGIAVISYTYGLVELAELPLAECQRDALVHNISANGQTCNMPKGYQLAAEVPRLRPVQGASLDNHDTLEPATETKIEKYIRDQMKARRIGLDDIEDDNQYIKTEDGDVLVDIEPRLRLYK